MSAIFCIPFLLLDPIPERESVQSPTIDHSAAGAAPSETPGNAPVPSTGETLRSAVDKVLRRDARGVAQAPAQAVPELVRLYRELEQDSQLTSVERKRLQNAVRVRLLQIESTLVRRFARTGASRPLRKPGSAGGAGAGAPDSGWDLVELIRNTVVPESWDVNGGTGTISYYAPLQVLVVRQTDGAHDEIADVLGQLRK